MAMRGKHFLLIRFGGEFGIAGLLYDNRICPVTEHLGDPFLEGYRGELHWALVRYDFEDSKSTTSLSSKNDSRPNLVGIQAVVLIKLLCQPF